MQTDMGDPSAVVSPKESAARLLTRFDKLDLANTGIYESYNGEKLPF